MRGTATSARTRKKTMPEIWTGRGEEAADSITLSYKPVAEYVMAIEDLEN